MAAVAILRSGVSAGGRPMAALACQPDLAADGGGPRVPPPAELPLSRAGAPAAGGGTGHRRAVRRVRSRGSAPSRRFGKIFLCSPRLLRVVCPLAALAASAVLLWLVPQGFTACDPAREAMGTAAETGTSQSPPDSAVAQESTSPHIVGPWHAGLSWFTAAPSVRRFHQEE